MRTLKLLKGFLIAAALALNFGAIVANSNEVASSDHSLTAAVKELDLSDLTL